MADEVTTKLNIDITQFKSALTEANRYIRLANSEFDKATAGAEKWSDSTDGLKAKITQLNKTLDAQETAAAALRLEYDRVSKEQGENSKGAQELAIKLNRQEAACEKTRAQIAKYSTALNDMGDEADDAGNEAKDLDKSLDKAGDSAKNAARDSDDLDKSLSGLPGVARAAADGFTVMKGALASLVADGIRAAIDGFKELISGGIEYNKAMESYTTSFEVMTGSAEKAAEVTEQLGVIAAKTPFEMTDLADATQLLMNYGFTADDAMDKMMMLGDISQGNADKMNSVATAYGQMSSAGKVSLEDVKQMIEAGFNPLQEISTTTGESMESLYERISKGTISVDEITASMERSTSAGGKYFQSMEKQSQTLTGRLSTLKDTINASLGAALEKVMGNISDNVLPKLTTALESINWAGIGDGINKMVDPLIKLVSGEINVAEFFTGMAANISAAVTQMAEKAREMSTSFVSGIKTALPALLSTGGEMVHQLLNGIVTNLPNMIQGAVSAVGGFVQGLQNNLPIILGKGAELLGKLGEGIRTALPGLVSQALDVIMNFATTIYDNAPTLITAGLDLLKNLVQGIMQSLPTLIAKAPEIISKFANTLNHNMPTILKKGAEIIWEIVKGIVSAIPTLIANIPKIIKAIVDVWTAFNWISLGKNAITAVKNGIQSMVGAVKTAGTNISNAVTNVIKQLPGKLLALGKQGITSLSNGIQSMIGFVQSGATNILSSIVSVIQALPGKLLAFGQEAISRLGSAISAGVTTVKSKATSVLNGIVNAFTGLPAKMVQIGKDAISGIINGIQSMVGALYDSIYNALSGLVDRAKAALGIGSPSKVLRDQVGKWIPAGIADGIKRNTKVATKEMVNTVKSTVGAANRELSGSSLNVGVSGSGQQRTSGGTGGATYVFNQYNTSPKPLNRAEIYRNTKNALRFATGTA